MNADRFTPTEIAEGEARLAKLLNRLSKEGFTGRPPFGARLDKIDEDIAPQNFRAFIITQRNGGWVADLLLHSPLQKPINRYGSLDVLGTQDVLPYPSYDDACVAGIKMVATLLAYAQSPSALRT